ncbi:uncharacterized protein BP5553_08836 [Venustampulla echinocandica]|uniref:Rhodopsin domain-containing protein n=1 Tax=Venustampulla echinocandica TaxID=2656787 RepID=A0A370TD34_9HELO|nr:uncharacterized protein BP5553_08836 [Venustampulla echinocandica]RDL32380.1 hypothetical protein BP5553_08836 [Venustampulla echinocandica]
MDIFRRLAAEAPEPRGFREDKPTLIMSWWCTIYAITTILLRIAGRYIRTEHIYIEDRVMLLAIVPLLIRIAVVHPILLYGTNNTVITELLPASIRQREIGSQLVLASRVMYAAYLWMVKYSTSVFLFSHIRKTSPRHVHRLEHLLLSLTFLATFISALAPCQPFTHYWQVVPDPGPQCRQGYVFLFVMGTLNIITNLAFVVLPLRVVFMSSLSKIQKFSITVRLALPLASVALTLYQIPAVIQHQGLQPFRTLIASIDILLATVVANAPVLVSLIQDRGAKKSKFKWRPSLASDNEGALRKAEAGWKTKWQDGNGKSKGRPDGKSAAGGQEIDRGMALEMDDMRPLCGGREFSRVDVNVGVGTPENVRLGDIRVATTWEVTQAGRVANV